ncbi:YlmC/YmxH family sporulation protein [Caproiciproducens sp. MSJ-32]|uniref:YlmC/YmxH family sporulation protein n=1 Tax=Caproiciproducens sp. MSJ-32 TaxID=2841527 RepID=UPI001C1291ED|nr:YlmC/YmxH family sporulation protein [Caproiciproducens sp. MSJ-32]MBU5454095.1 YlmC/YmxH family sporulation protein [Caproiciproducens sp. MSJ-32]
MGFFDNFKLEENMSSEEKEKENELLLHSLNALRTMEVIDIKTGTKLGYIKDIVIDIENSKIVSILLPGLPKGWFSKEEDIEIPWDKVIKAGMEIILIDSSELDNFNYNI